MLHEWLLFIHIVGVVLFVGGGITLVAQAPAPSAPAPVSR